MSIVACPPRVLAVYDDLQVAQEVWGLLHVKSDEYDRLSSTCATGITARVGQLEESAFHAGITQAFTVAHSHYDREINLEVMSLGFPPSYEDDELDEIEKAVAPLA